MLISVIGGGNHPPQDALDMAEEVGRELARRGITVVCGGLDGVMEAVCRGAKAEGGVTIGILPGNDPTEANPWVDYPICTGMGYARNVIVVKSGRAVIAIDGAYGTLSEIGHALGDGIPVVGLATWSLARNGSPERGIIQARTPAEAVEKAL
ncbi:MAG: TIGR00725 family protein, partial [Dehalococcoidia bacterium]|nr:TIGR00725 family protein [Dehalococcoidia bacterium]